MTLGLYFARRFLNSLGLVVAVVAGLMTLIEMVELIRSYAGTEMTVARAAQLAALTTPRAIYQMLPLLVLIGTIALFLSLARSSELVVTRAAGRSALRAALAPAIAALLLGAAVIALGNPIVAATSRAYDRLLGEYTRGPESLLQISDEALWLRQANPDGQSLIRAARANYDGTMLFGVTFLAFDGNGLPVSRVEADRAMLTAGSWRLTGAKEWRLDDQNPEVSAKRMAEADLETDLTPEKIRDSFGAAISISIWDLPAFIDNLSRAGFSTVEHRVWLQMELAQPLMLAAMVLLAAGFTMRHTRFGRSGQMVMLALLAGFGMFVLRNFAQLMGEQAQIPVALAAWSVPVVTLFMAVALLLYLEDG